MRLEELLSVISCDDVWYEIFIRLTSEEYISETFTYTKNEILDKENEIKDMFIEKIEVSPELMYTSKKIEISKRVRIWLRG